MTVIDVACGSGDAHTVCVTECGDVYAFGDGDYGKVCLLRIHKFTLVRKVFSLINVIGLL